MEGERKIPGQKREELLENWVLGEIMDSIGAYVYVTDVETDEILFMNRAMKEAFSLEQPEGKVCWQVLQKGMERRCEFCPRQILREGADPYFWEETNTKTGRVYENYDSLIHWTDGRLAHVQQSIDVTNVPADIDQNKEFPQTILENGTKTRYVDSEFFKVDRYQLNGKNVIKNDEPFMMVSIIEGTGIFEGNEVKKGDHFVICSDQKEVTFDGDMEVMISTL